MCVCLTMCVCVGVCVCVCVCVWAVANWGVAAAATSRICRRGHSSWPLVTRAGATRHGPLTSISQPTAGKSWGTIEGLWEAPASSSDFATYLFIQFRVSGISAEDVEAIADGKANRCTSWSAPMFLSFLQINGLTIARCGRGEAQFVWASRVTGKPIFPSPPNHPP